MESKFILKLIFFYQTFVKKFYVTYIFYEFEHVELRKVKTVFIIYIYSKNYFYLSALGYSCK